METNTLRVVQSVEQRDVRHHAREFRSTTPIAELPSNVLPFVDGKRKREINAICIARVCRAERNATVRNWLHVHFINDMTESKPINTGLTVAVPICPRRHALNT